MQTLVTHHSPQSAYDRVLQDARRRLGTNAVAALALIYASPAPLSSAVIQAGTGMTRTHTSVVLLRLEERHYILKLNRGLWQRHPDILTLFPAPVHPPVPGEADEPVSLGALDAAGHRTLHEVTSTCSAATLSVLEAVLRSPHPTSVDELSTATALPQRRVRTILSRLKQRCLVDQPSRGLYERHPFTRIARTFLLEAER